MTTTTVTNGNDPADLQQTAVCFSVKLSRPSLRRKVGTGQVQVDADERAIHVSKEILESDTYDAVKKLDHEIRRYLYSRCLPSLLRRGVYLLPVALIKEVEDQVAAFRRRRTELVERFKGEYEDAIEQAKVRLRTLFDPTDYVGVEELGALFQLETRMFTVDVPTVLEAVSRQAFEREREKARQFWAETREAIAAVLRAEFKDLVDHLVERLTDDADGKPKTFRNSLVNNFQEWMDLFESRDLSKDGALREAVTRARRAMSGVTADDLRDADRTRAYVRQAFETIKATADTLVIEKPKRAFNFDDEA